MLRETKIYYSILSISNTPMGSTKTCITSPCITNPNLLVCKFFLKKLILSHKFSVIGVDASFLFGPSCDKSFPICFSSWTNFYAKKFESFLKVISKVITADVLLIQSYSPRNRKRSVLRITSGVLLKLNLQLTVLRKICCGQEKFLLCACALMMFTSRVNGHANQNLCLLF